MDSSTSKIIRVGGAWPPAISDTSLECQHSMTSLLVCVLRGLDPAGVASRVVQMAYAGSGRTR